MNLNSFIKKKKRKNFFIWTILIYFLKNSNLGDIIKKNKKFNKRERVFLYFIFKIIIFFSFQFFFRYIMRIFVIAFTQR
jgi:hypothetical protein